MHVHQFGVGLGPRILGSVFKVVESSAAPLTTSGAIKAGGTMALPVGGKVKSILVCATTSGKLFPDGVTAEVGGKEFDLSKGPLQWESGGHFECPFSASVEKVTVRNKSGDDCAASITVLPDQPVKTAAAAAAVDAGETADKPKKSKSKSQGEPAAAAAAA